MRPTPRLTSTLALTVLSLLVSGCSGVATVVRQAASPMTVPPGTPRAPSVALRLPDGVQISTDPMPHPVRVYRTPQWDPETSVLAGEVAEVLIAPMGVLWPHLSDGPLPHGPSIWRSPFDFVADLPPWEWSGSIGCLSKAPEQSGRPGSFRGTEIGAPSVRWFSWGPAR